MVGTPVSPATFYHKALLMCQASGNVIVPSPSRLRITLTCTDSRQSRSRFKYYRQLQRRQFGPAILFNDLRII